MSRASLTRAVGFSAAHRYHRPDWTEEENRRVFGKCANAPGHGHNYRCEVTVEGTVDPGTGMVVDLGELDRVLEEQVSGPMDHAFLNELPEFREQGRIPTTEELARVIWERVGPRLPEGCELARVRVREDRDLWSDYEGG